MMDFLRLTDLFEIKCRKCGSIDVTLSVDECEECGNTVSAYCSKCKSNYEYHDFKQIEK